LSFLIPGGIFYALAHVGESSMSIRGLAYLTYAAFFMVCVHTMPAQALTMQECSAKYKEAQTAGSLNGLNWNDFRKSQCESSTAPATASAAASNPASPGAAAPATGSSNVVFPTAVASKYSGESARNARMHTCLDQYKANKTAGGNGSLKWIQKGGGYYRQCSKRLKGA
jgi:hypothetical protein